MLYVSKAKYTAPEMDVIDFGNEDVCTSSMNWGVTDSNGNVIGGGGVIEEKPGDLDGEITG